MSGPQSVPLHPKFAALPLLDYLCVLWPDRARRTLHGLFARGQIRSDGQPVSPQRTVGELGNLTLHVPLSDVKTMFDAHSDRDVACGDELDLLHEDARFVVINKPAGLSVVPDRAAGRSSCLELLTRRELASRVGQPVASYIRYRIVHRIDRWTSGLVIVAKTPEAERQLSADFGKGRIAKEYQALVCGQLEADHLEVRCPIGPGRKGKMRAEPAGGVGTKEAHTEFELIERLGEVSLVRARPRTGRQHQIRVHAWFLGHPLAVDSVYGVGSNARRGESLAGLERLSLHSLRYTLPESWEEPRSFTCPLAGDFAQAVDRLRVGDTTW